MGIHFCCHEVNAIYGSAFGWIIGYLRGSLIQPTDPRLLRIRFRLQIGNIPFVCLCLLHGLIDLRQCGGHARAIADFPSHLQRICFDTVHAVQRLAVSRESCGLRLQSGDVGFIRGDFRFGCIQITLICFIPNRGIQIIPLSLQVSYVFHQSAGSITNRGFKSCYVFHQSTGSITNLGCKICNRSFVSLSI